MNDSVDKMTDLWSSTEDERAVSDPQFLIDVEGFEGPLDLLLELARRQKVDLARISILALAEQYLLFIEEARKVRIELAADYLVMAAWLAFLKSKLLLPDVESGEDGPTGEELAAQLAFRLQRLEAMREAGKRLVNRNRLGRDFFRRGDPEPMLTDTSMQYSATLYDFLTAYTSMRQRQSVSSVSVGKRSVWSLADARAILTRLVGRIEDWTPLDQYLIQFIPDPKQRVTAMASSFAASLELVREGVLQMRQEGAYQPIYLKEGRGRPDFGGSDQDNSDQTRLDA